MAIPRVFVSSTFYDLKYIRENLKYFIRTVGYDPVLSEEGDVYYDPQQHTHDACLTEVPSCQIFVLIIGGRYGGAFKDTEKSITNMEYETAIEHKVPVFALVEANVLGEHKLYNENSKKNKTISTGDIVFPSVDNIKIFEFIDEVRKHTVNNAIVPFRDFTDIETYLKKQWAGMMFSFLHTSITNTRVASTLEEITKVNEKIEFLTTEILNTVGKGVDMVTVKLYEEMIASDAYRILTFFKTGNPPRHVKATPADFIRAATFEELAKHLGVQLNILDTGTMLQSGDGRILRSQYNVADGKLRLLQSQFNHILGKAGLNFDKYLQEYDRKIV